MIIIVFVVVGCAAVVSFAVAVWTVFNADECTKTTATPSFMQCKDPIDDDCGDSVALQVPAPALKDIGELWAGDTPKPIGRYKHVKKLTAFFGDTDWVLAVPV